MIAVFLDDFLLKLILYTSVFLLGKGFSRKFQISGFWVLCSQTINSPEHNLDESL